MTRTPSGFTERLLASLTDFFFIFLPVNFVMYLKSGEFSVEQAAGMTWQVIDAAYLTVVPLAWGGYTLGKWLFKINIRQMDEQAPSLKNMLLREVVGKVLLTYLTFGLSNIVSAFMIIFREDKRAIHDFIAGTYVRYDERFKGSRLL